MSRIFHKPTVDFMQDGDIITANVKPFQTITKKEVNYLKEVVDETINGPFGFIDNRPEHSQVSIDPAVYQYVLALIDNVKAYALVTDSRISQDMFINIESLFLDEHKPADFHYKLFTSITDAKEWIQDILIELNPSP